MDTINQEWLNESGMLEFEHNNKKCLILRVEGLGHLCGYVGINKPLQNEDEINVHGGVTFNHHTQDTSDVMKEYFKDCEYVVGFDCAHHSDLTPAMANLGGTYRNMAYVKRETMDLAEQL